MLKLAGELDLATVPDLKAALAARNGVTEAATLDLSELTFIDSSGIHAIVEYARSGEWEAPVTLTGVSPQIFKLFEITRLTEHQSLRIDGKA
jgi:anti-sigma B factor antagonist